jgi:putative phosphoribosyl transferase
LRSAQTGSPTAMERRFRDRAEAGRLLAERLSKYAGRDNVVVLALPRGGVPVAYEVAKRLGAPLGVFLVRKVGVPGQEELAMGAIASGGVIVLDERLLRVLDVDEELLRHAVEAEARELDRRATAYDGNREPPQLEGKTVMLIDDGLATGASMRAAALAVKELKPAWVIVAVPVAAAQTCSEFQDLVDEVVCAVTPEPFFAVGLWYEDFSQTTDDEVRELLDRSAAEAETRG